MGDPDANNLLIIQEGVGLIRFRGNAVPVQFGDRGSITVTDVTNGHLTVALDATGVDVLSSGRAIFAVVKELADTSRQMVEAG